MKQTLLPVAVLTGALAAQAALPAPVSTQPSAAPRAGAASGDLRIPVHTRADEPGLPTYGVWAAGDDYKARFDGGMTFVPRLGADYPHNQPFAWQTTSVRVGETELLTTGRAPGMTHTDYRVEYHHAGGAVVEAYDVLAHGLEQTFVLARRPATGGDLTITGRTTTALWTAAVVGTSGELLFRDANGTPILTYGRAIAIDADGDQFAMSTTCDGAHITLRLAAPDLAVADFPLVVDPLLAAVTPHAIGSAAALGQVDAASESVSGSVTTAVAFTRHFSATDLDVHARIGSISLGSTTAVFADIATTTSADHPRLAHVAATNRWVIVYQSLIHQTQLMQIRAGMFLGGTSQQPTVSTSIPHLVLPGIHEWRPAVSGIAAGGSGSGALVVFQQEAGTAQFANTANSRVLGMFFDTAAPNGQWNAPFLVQGLAGEDTERPSVNRMGEGGAAFSRFVVCQTFVNNAGNDDWDLIGKLVDHTGSVSGNQWISSLGTIHKLGPVVDGRFGRYCVTFSTANTSTGKVQDVLGNDLRCERLDWAHGDSAPSAAGNLPTETLASNSFRILEATGIAFNGVTRSHWALTWRSSSTSPATYLMRVGYRGKALQNPELIDSSLGVSIAGPAAVAHNDSLRATTTCYQTANSGTNQLMARSFAYDIAAIPTFQSSTCSSIGLDWRGLSGALEENQRIGCEFSGPAAVGAPANGLHLLLVATATANVPLADPILGSNCTLLVPFTGPDYLGYLPLAVGSTASWQLPLPETLPAMTLHFQDWVLDPADGRFYGSERLTVPLSK
jgi:hypothetical protein